MFQVGCRSVMILSAIHMGEALYNKKKNCVVTLKLMLGSFENESVMMLNSHYK